MSETDFHTFLTGGLALLLALMTVIAWHLWRIREETRLGSASALEGVGHELRVNLHRMISELSQIAYNPGVGPDVLLPIRSPQLDGVNRSLINTNRNGIAVLGTTYQEIEARKLTLRAILAQGRVPETELDDAMDAVINGIAALYIWEVHKGALPREIGRVRSWSVRDWMKEKNFRAEAFPEMHLRDEVVERLRLYGLELTPRPLTLSAWEYYSMQYDRHADVRGPLGRRRQEGEGRGGLLGLFGLGRKEEAEEQAEDDFAPEAETYEEPAPLEEQAEETPYQPSASEYVPAPAPEPAYQAEPPVAEPAPEPAPLYQPAAPEPLPEEDQEYEPAEDGAPDYSIDPQRTN